MGGSAQVETKLFPGQCEAQQLALLHRARSSVWRKLDKECSGRIIVADYVSWTKKFCNLIARSGDIARSDG